VLRRRLRCSPDGRRAVLGGATATLDELTVADDPGAWSDVGFEVEGDAFAVGGVRIRLAGPGAGKGLIGWALRGAASDELDGLPTELVDDTASASAPARRGAGQGRQIHPSGIVALDHVVAISPDLDRTVEALKAAGLDLRRVREEPTPAGAPRQAFFGLGPAILEVVQEPPEAIERGGGPDRPAFFWGLAFVAADLDQTVAALGERTSLVRDAVQPGRRISTLRRSAGLSVPVALMSPR
jgi:hypothetical protein